MNNAASPLNIVLAGAGLIGRRHANLIAASPNVHFAAIVDPSDQAEEVASQHSTKRFSDLDSLFDEGIECDGMVIATPNETHREFALRCIEKRTPCLIEKPLAANSDDGLAIVSASEAAEVPILVGHHRRHHGVSKMLKERIAKGQIGTPVGAQLTWALRKPDDYFSAGKWRTEPGGGPIWINLIHEVDLMRFFLGEVSEVFAMLSGEVRGNSVEDTGVITMRFQSGALASAFVSDCAPSPWHFEGGSGENPNIAKTGRGGLRIFGTEGSIEFPSLNEWRHDTSDGHWGTPIECHEHTDQQELGGEAALQSQLENFVNVIGGSSLPVVSARDGLQSVRVIEAIHQSAKSGAVSVVSQK